MKGVEMEISILELYLLIKDSVRRQLYQLSYC